jgi:hypothetical protein
MIRALDVVHTILVAIVARLDIASDHVNELRAAVETARDELRRRRT